MRKTPAETANTSTEGEKHEWLTNATVGEIEEFLRHVNPSSNLWIQARSALQFRLGEESRRPHWMVNSTFWLVVVATILASISAWPVLCDWFQDDELTSTTLRSGAAQSNLAPASGTTSTPAPSAQ